MLYTYGDILATEIFDFLATYWYRLREKKHQEKKDRENNLFKIYIKQSKSTQDIMILQWCV